MITCYFQAFFIYSYKDNNQTLISLLLSLLFSFHSSSAPLPFLFHFSFTSLARVTAEINKSKRRVTCYYDDSYVLGHTRYVARDSFRRWSVIMLIQRDLDMSMVLSTFFLRNIGIWVTNYPTEERRMKIMIIYTIWNSIFATIIIIRDLYFTVLYKGVSILLWCIEKRDEQLR